MAVASRRIWALLASLAASAAMAGCAGNTQAPGEDGPGQAGQGTPLGAGEPGTITASNATPPRQQQHTVEFDGVLGGGVCVPVPLAGYCTGGGVPSEDDVVVEQAGAALWRLDVTMTWEPTTPLSQELSLRAMPFRACGNGCIESYGVEVAVDGTSPLRLSGDVEAPADSDGLWIAVTGQTWVAGGYVEGPQAFELVGEATAVLG